MLEGAGSGLRLHAGGAEWHLGARVGMPLGLLEPELLTPSGALNPFGIC